MYDALRWPVRTSETATRFFSPRPTFTSCDQARWPRASTRTWWLPAASMAGDLSGASPIGLPSIDTSAPDGASTVSSAGLGSRLTSTTMKRPSTAVPSTDWAK
jgi:hypothetical protein